MLAANEEAQHYFERAAELADDPLVEAGLRERAGATAWVAGRRNEARAQYERALEVYETQNLTHPAARVSARLGEAEWRTGHLDEALERMERAFEVLSGDEPDADLATLAAELGRLHFFRGEIDLAARRVDTAIEIAESLWLPEVLSQVIQPEGAPGYVQNPGTYIPSQNKNRQLVSNADPAQLPLMPGAASAFSGTVLPVVNPPETTFRPGLRYAPWNLRRG